MSLCKCLNAECHYAECHYAECRGANQIERSNKYDLKTEANPTINFKRLIYGVPE